MARRKAAETEMGRPRAIPMTAEKFEVIAAALKDAATYLGDTAKFMHDNSLSEFTLPAAKVMDEHLPAIQAFARRAFAEVGPALTSKQLGRKTKLEQNQQRHERYGKQKAAK